MLSFTNNEAKSFLDIVRSELWRKIKAEEAVRFFDDEQDDTTFELIRRRFASPESFRIFHVNMVRKIITRKAAAYQSTPARTFEGWDQQAGEALYASANIDAVMKRASKLTKLLKTTALQVRYGPNGLAINVLPPNILDVEHTDPNYPDRIIVTHAHHRPDCTTYSDWTATTFMRRDAAGRPIAIPGNASNVNPYGVLPFVPLFDRLPDHRFFLPGSDDLIGSQKALNVGLANLWRAVELQAHGQAVAKGLHPGDPIATGPDKVIILPENGSFAFANTNAPIDAILNALEFLMRQTAATNDVGADVFDLSKTAESGSAKEAERTDLKESRQDDISLWRSYEARLFQIIKVVVNTHAPGTIPEAATLRVDFNEQGDVLTEAELLANLEIKTALSVFSPVDVLMALNPDSYPTRAEAYLELSLRKQEAEELTFTPVTTDLTITPVKAD
jgi:hypothetical protein